MSGIGVPGSTFAGGRGWGRQLAAGVRTGTQHVAHRVVVLPVDEGELYVWGCNRDGQLGVGTDVNHLTPWPVTALRGYRVLCVAAGYGHTVVVAGTSSRVCVRTRMCAVAVLPVSPCAL